MYLLATCNISLSIPSLVADAAMPVTFSERNHTLKVQSAVLHTEEGRAAERRGEERILLPHQIKQACMHLWLPDCYSQIFRSYVFGPSGFWTMAPLCYAAKFDTFLSLVCAPTPSTLVQSKERKGSNFAIWQPRLWPFPAIKGVFSDSFLPRSCRGLPCCGRW